MDLILLFLVLILLHHLVYPMLQTVSLFKPPFLVLLPLSPFLPQASSKAKYPTHLFHYPFQKTQIPGLQLLLSDDFYSAIFRPSLPTFWGTFQTAWRSSPYSNHLQNLILLMNHPFVPEPSGYPPSQDLKL